MQNAEEECTTRNRGWLPVCWVGLRGNHKPTIWGSNLINYTRHKFRIGAKSQVASPSNNAGLRVRSRPPRLTHAMKKISWVCRERLTGYGTGTSGFLSLVFNQPHQDSRKKIQATYKSPFGFLAELITWLSGTPPKRIRFGPF